MPPAAGEPQPPPAPPPDDDAATSDALASHALDNAAVRDTEIERMLRSYFALLESLYRVVSAQQSPSPQSAEHYDPLPQWRLEAQLAPDLDALAQRSAAVQASLLDFAQRMNIDLLGIEVGRNRAARVRLLFRVATCARRDAQVRAVQGMAFAQAMQQGATERAVLATQPAPMHYLTDMTMLARTMACAKLAAQAMPNGS